jgi:acetyltransferase-like isoleucine patch superfamily enzyme
VLVFLRRLGLSVASLYEFGVTFLPGEAGRRLRTHYWRSRLRSLGAGTTFEVGVRITNPQHVSIGVNCWLDHYVVLLAGPPRRGARKIARRPGAGMVAEGDLVIGPNTHVAPHVVISGHGGVLIEGDTTIAAGSKLYSLSHHHSNLSDLSDTRLYRFSSRVPDQQQSLLSAPVVIGRSAAVALNSVVLPGVTIGREAWLAPGSVATHDVPERTLAAGAPARIKKAL